MTGASTSRGPLRGILLVAATYTYFLLFAQFGFLELLQERLGGAGDVRLAMTAMGVAGLSASLLTALLLKRHQPPRLVRVGFVGCAAAALLALPASSLGTLAGAAAAIGGFTGLLTVALAAGLRAWLPGRRWALDVGIGTGAAYLVCNLPPLFEARPEVQALLVATTCLAGFAAAGRVTPPEESSRGAAGRGGRLRYAAALLSFMVLIWIDSAAFAVIQDSPELKAMTWGGPGQKMVLGGLHLLAALAAGWLLRRGLLRELLLATLALFAVAFALLDRSGGLGLLAGPLYVIGISFYSVALIVYAAGSSGGLPRRWRAALLYGLAGWLGSALGVGMAQDLHTIPAPLIAAAGLVIVGSWLAGRPTLGRTLVRVYGRTALLAGAGVLLSLGVLRGESASSPTAGDPEAEQIARGREVYLSEGCINCHSRFVRCDTADEELWGPCGAPPEEASPPLIGNRRQGPDLLNAGNRRSAEWHRMHLRDPRALSPGSRMPGYAHLFEDGSRGEDLVAWLASLGGESRAQRFEYTRAVPVADPAGKGSADRGAELFTRHCAACHGRVGRGDGVLSGLFRRPAMDLTKGSFWLVPRGPGIGTEAEGLARLVRFGVPGTSMPGHEYLSDRQVADLVAFVRDLAAEPMAARGAAP
jgi:mono/diheme cytochrome c family protein